MDAAAISVIDNDEFICVATGVLLEAARVCRRYVCVGGRFLGSPAVHASRCLIVDVQMPGMNGLALQKRLRDEGNGTPIVFITAFPEERNRAHAMAAGATCFLSKPFDGQTLIGCVNKALNNS